MLTERTSYINDSASSWNNATEKELYLLMDNARIHHARIVKKYIETTEHKILFNVPDTHYVCFASFS